MKEALLGALVLTLAAVPLAAATLTECLPQGMGCAGTHTSYSGSCNSAGSEAQSAYANVATQGVVIAASAGESCSASSGYGYRAIGAGAAASDAHTGKAESVQAVWWAQHSTFDGYCNTYVVASGAAGTYQPFGCPAGGPVDVPNVLP